MSSIPHCVQLSMSGPSLFLLIGLCTSEAFLSYTVSFLFLLGSMSGEERSKNSSENSGRVAGLENLGTA